MDLYNDIESFIEAYLCSDESPTEIPQQRKLCSKNSNNSDQGLYDFDKLIEREFNTHVQGTLTPVHKHVNRGNAAQKPTNFHETGRHNFDETVKYNCTNVQTILEHSCCHCRFKCSDLPEMRYHHWIYHVHLTSNECRGYPNQLSNGARK